MKQQIEIKDLESFKYLSNIKGNQKHLSYVLTKQEDDQYINALYVYEKENKQMTSFDKILSYIYDDEDMILFTRIKSEDKKRLEEGEEFTSFYRLSLNGGEAIKVFELPFQVLNFKKIEQHKYVMMVDMDLNFIDMERNKDGFKDEFKSLKKKNEPYEVLDELPFYINGGGYINKHRKALLIYDEEENKYEIITETYMDVNGIDIDDHKIYYFGEEFKVKSTGDSHVFVYDLNNKETTTLFNGNKFMIYDLKCMPYGLLCITHDQARYGVNENPQFYILKDGKMELFAENDDAIFNSVGSDVRLGGGQGIIKKDDMLYFLSTRYQSCNIYALDANGNISTILEVDGCVDCMELSDEGIYFVGFIGQRLQELYFYDEKTKEIKQLSKYNESFYETKDVLPLEEIIYESDGEELYGYVIKPRNYIEGSTYPAILDIHGGPKTVYGTTYYHEMQVWANKGYFVFFTNPRGSDGRGNEFSDIRGKYGTIDYDDLMKFCDVVLEKYADIDASNVGVTGGSYGGFMTNWIIGHTNRFKAAASQRSISNWISFMGTSDIGEIFAKDQCGATPWDNLEKVWWHSPLKYADQVTTPTLFIHSDCDYRCPYEQGLQMYSALQMHHVETRLAMFKNENHELSRSGIMSHRIRRLEEITNWMDSHLRG